MTSVEDVVKILRDFDVTKAHCYNPNEESRLITVITAVGVDKFNESIRDVAAIYSNRQTRSTRRKRRQDLSPELKRDRSAAKLVRQIVEQVHAPPKPNRPHLRQLGIESLERG